MKKIILILILTLFIFKVQSQDARIVYTTSIAPDTDAHIDGVTSEDGLLYVLTEHDIVIMSYDCNTLTTEILDTIAFDTNLTLRDMYLTNDWIYLSLDGNHRSIRRLSRDAQNTDLEMLADNLYFPSALVATQTHIYYRDYESIYKLNLNDLSAAPELIIEDYRLDLEGSKMALIDGFVYASGGEVIYKVNTANDDVELIPLPGVYLDFALVSIGTDKLLGKASNELYVIDLVDNSYFSIGFIDCDLGAIDPWSTACGTPDLAVIDSSIYITGAESPYVITFKLPTSGFADADGDTFGDPGTIVNIIDNNFSQDVVFNATDCDDTNPNVNPNQTEVPYNNLDDDCNAVTLDDDLDQDGFAIAFDCDDENSNINPDAIEIPNNEIDEDCDGSDLISSSLHNLANSTISIYPNPVINEINIEVDGDIQYGASLYSVVGELISYVENEKIISVNSMPQGIYLLEIKDLKSGNKIVEKLTVCK